MRGVSVKQGGIVNNVIWEGWVLSKAEYKQFMRGVSVKQGGI